MAMLGNGSNTETESTVFFYTPKFHGLDNFSAVSIYIWDNIFPTAEHAYQWKKFHNVDSDLADKILKAASPYEVKVISDANKHKVSPDWSVEKVRIMEEILQTKLSQHEEVQKQLLKTKLRLICENSPTDSFWGIGPDGKGENVLGLIWMKLRDNFKEVTK